MTDAGDTSRRSLILKTAAKLFREHGYERTSVRQIAEALGMTSGSIFYHFTTKEELLVTVMEEGVRDILSGVQTGLAGESRLPERMLAMVRCHLTALLGPKLDAMTVMLYEWRSLSEPARARVLTSRDAYEELWMAPIDVRGIRSTNTRALGRWALATVQVRQPRMVSVLSLVFMPKSAGSRVQCTRARPSPGVGLGGGTAGETCAGPALPRPCGGRVGTTGRSS